VEARRFGARPLFGHWIDLLALAAGGEASLVCAGFDGDGALDLRAARVTPAEALGHLNTLAETYLEGQQRPLCFLPDLAESYLEAVEGERPRPPADALARLNDRLTDGFHPHWAAGDVWFQRVLAGGDAPLGADPDASEFCALATTLLRPMTLAVAAIGAEAWLAGADGEGGP
ncbi:MAG: hypothetical protein RIE74_10270, partial [Pseudomonadales bacterium]